MKLFAAPILKKSFLVLVGILLLSAKAPGQQLIHRPQGNPDEEGFGNQVLGLGDVNDDGVADFVVGDFKIADERLPSETDSIVVFDGASGTRLYKIDGIPQPFQRISPGRRHNLAGLGDVNGDGSADILLGMWSLRNSDLRTGILRIYNGRDGQLIREHTDTIPGSGSNHFGRFNTSVGDVDGDGVTDYATSAHYEGAGGLNRELSLLFSGVSGEQLAALHSGGLNHAGNPSLVETAPIGDFNRDGVADLLIRGENEDILVVSGGVRGEVDLVDHPAVLQRISVAIINIENGEDYDGFNQFGSAGDVNGDGVLDVFLGGQTVSGDVFSGNGGSRLHKGLRLDFRTQRGSEVLGVGDIDGDGHDDVAYGFRATSRGNPEESHLTLYSGRTWRPILTIGPSEPFLTPFPAHLDLLDDINGDGFPELIIGAGHRTGRDPAGFRGYVEVISLKPPIGPIPAIHTLTKVGSNDPFSQRWRLQWYSEPGKAYSIQASQDLNSWIPSLTGDPIRAGGTSTHTSVNLPIFWERGYLRIVEEAP